MFQDNLALEVDHQNWYPASSTDYHGASSIWNLDAIPIQMNVEMLVYFSTAWMGGKSTLWLVPHELDLSASYSGILLRWQKKSPPIHFMLRPRYFLPVSGHLTTTFEKPPYHALMCIYSPDTNTLHIPWVASTFPTLLVFCVSSPHTYTFSVC